MGSSSIKKISSSLYFVTGNDESQVRRRAQEKVLELVPDPHDIFGLEIIEASSDAVDQTIDALEKTIQALLTFPFLGGKKLVWLKNISCLKETPTGRSPRVQSTLEELLVLLQAGLLEGVTFLMSAPQPDKRRSFYKGLSSLATLILCDKPDFGFNASEEDIIEWMIQRAHAHALSLDPQAAEILATRLGANSGELEIELLKLGTAAGASNYITKELVEQLVPLTRLGGIFDLSNALAQRNLPIALKTLEQLLYQGESALGLLLAAITPTVRNLLLVKELMERHRIKPPAKPAFFSAILQKLPAEATNHLPRKKDGTLNAYGLGISAINAVAFERQELLDGFLACRNTHVRLLQGQRSTSVLLTELLIKIMKGNRSSQKEKPKHT